MLHIRIVHAHGVSTQIPREKKFRRVENVIKQLVHTSAVCSSRYEVLGKFINEQLVYASASVHRGIKHAGSLLSRAIEFD